MAVKSPSDSTHQNTEPLPSTLQRLVGDVRVVVMANRPRRSGEFDAHIAEALAMAPRMRATLVVNLEPGAAMTATERKRLVSVGLFAFPCAVLMEGAVARSIFTALRWLGVVNVGSFAPHELHKACDYLRVSSEQRESIATAIRQLTAQLGPSSRASGLAARDVVKTAERIEDVVAERLERIRGMSTATTDPNNGRT